MKTEYQKPRFASHDIGTTPDNSLRVFKGASAIVTGGASGIGRALGELLASRGTAVCLADRQIDVAEQVAYQVMLKQGFGHIVNTASMAGLSAAPGATAYAATKHAVVGLSRSLRIEASLEDIRVSVLCPGAIRTPILEGGGKYGKNYADMTPEQERRMWDKVRPMPPDAFARKALAAVAKNKAIIVIPSWWKLIWYTDRLFPSLATGLARKSYSDLRETSEGQVH